MFRTRFFDSHCIAIHYPPETSISLSDLFEGRVVFVWDELMDPETVRDLLGRYVAMAPAFVTGRARRAEREGAKKRFRLVEEEGAITQGLVLIGLSEEELTRLDDHQRAPIHLARQKEKVRIGDLERVVEIYLSSGAYLGEE